MWLAIVRIASSIRLSRSNSIMDNMTEPEKIAHPIAANTPMKKTTCKATVPLCKSALRILQHNTAPINADKRTSCR